MGFDSKTLPDSIRRCMQQEHRKEISCPTQQEADAKFIHRAEKKLQENIAALLRQRNIVFFSQRMDKRTRGPKGWPDFVFAINGQACAVECKTMDGKLTNEQGKCLMGLGFNGWRITVVRSEAEFLAFINDVIDCTTRRDFVGLPLSQTERQGERGAV